jgi:energy-converting hydrogenase B subunit D
MIALQIAALVAVAVGGTATVLVREPVRQAVVSGIFGFALAVLFFVYEAPDVALSQIVVATVAIPLMVLLTVAKLRQHEQGGDGDGEGGEAEGEGG